MESKTTMPTLDLTNRNLFYIGDLAYVLSDDDWNTHCVQFDYRDPNTYNLEDGYDSEIFLNPEAADWESFINDNGAEPWRPCRSFPTAYGDGQYNDGEGLPYCVDSGGIGCIRVDHANPEKLADAVERGLGHVHEFEEEPSCGYEDGLIWFCDHTHQVEIQTGGSYDEDEEEDTEED